MQVLHIVMIVCGTLAAGLPQIEASLPPSQTSYYFKLATSILVLVATVCGALSDKMGARASDAAKAILFFVGVSVAGTAVAASTEACSPALENAIIHAAEDDLACALANIDLPDDQIVTKCLDRLPTAERAKVLAHLHEQRAARAKLSTEAHARGFDEARAKLGACQPGLATDAGAPKDGGK